jgi:inhibitor of KinA
LVNWGRMQISQAAGQSFSVYYLSEQAITLEFGRSIDWGLSQKIVGFQQRLEQNPFPGFLTAVTAYATLSVFFDPVLVTASADLPGRNCFEKVSNYVYQLGGGEGLTYAPEREPVVIPVFYGGGFGPDLQVIAKMKGLSEQEVINLHSAAIYRVYMIGFVPGFAYMGGLPDVLVSPRLPSPRSAVVAGSVGIAGRQTGVYPLETPAGWQIIGRTPLRLFDASRSQPALLKAGDQVIFKPIDRASYEQLMETRDAAAHN